MPCWKEGGGESFVEIKNLGKVFPLIRLLFAEDLLLDEVEDHVAHILAFSDSPFRHEGGCHGAELIERAIAESPQQFRAADVARLSAIVFGDALEREVERILEKKIGMRIETIVAFQYGNNGLFKLHGLHGK